MKLQVTPHHIHSLFVLHMFGRLVALIRPIKFDICISLLILYHNLIDSKIFRTQRVNANGRLSPNAYVIPISFKERKGQKYKRSIRVSNWQLLLRDFIKRVMRS